MVVYNIRTALKLAAIWINWGDGEILHHSVNAIRDFVDCCLLVDSDKSNTGEISVQYKTCTYNTRLFSPDEKRTMRENETDKRNLGLDWAREKDFTHFLMLDSDEMYGPFDKTKFDGNYVCRTKLYFKSPELTLGMDTTLVPFIHKLTPDLKFVRNYNYPFSHDNGKPLIDPTRTMNINEGVQMCDVVMHHYSYIRSDIRKKIRNSSGVRVKHYGNQLIYDYQHAKEGYTSKFFGKKMQKAENIFNLPEIVDHSLCPPVDANTRDGQ